MEIKLNGASREVRENSSISQLLAELQIENRNLAIEFNGQFLEPGDLDRTILRPGDQLEIVRFVGGG